MRRLNSTPLLAALLALGCQPRTPAPRTPTPDVPPPATHDAGAPATDASVSTAPATRLTPFGSAEALQAWIHARAARSNRNRRGHGAAEGGSGFGLGNIGTQGFGGMMAESASAPPAPPMAQAAAAPAPTAVAPAPAGRASAATGTTATNGPGTRVANADDGITNNQVQGVDEGDIVKTHGDQLVILRRGRLFSVRLGDAAMTPVSMVDAYGRGRAPGGWYDEMLVDGDTIVVIGYSYAARASEVGLFDIDATGHIRWRDTLFVRSSDYYSSRNYASRLVGHHLVMYMPVPLHEAADANLPSIRRAPDAAWETVLPYSQLFRPVQSVGYGPVIHTVMSCDLSGRGFDCRAVGVVGPAGRTFYVSGSAVYLWVDGQPEPAGDPAIDARRPPPAVVYRMPLSCDAIGAVRARGNPLDQFSFDESAGTLRVFVRAEGGGDGMWNSETRGGDVGFLRVPVSRFSEELPEMAGSAYRGLPRVEADAGTLQDRFVGDHFLYGAGQGWGGGRPAGATHPVWVYDVAHDTTARVDVTHSIERLEPLGRDALAVGNEDGGLTFSAIALDDTPAVAGRHTVRGAAQGETRSHGFFYLPSGDRRGMLGLPITRGNDEGGWSQLRNVSSSVLFLGVDGLRFTDAGSLRSGSAPSTDDHCVASCADWYGNARPIFWRGRVFALLGYELVEGALTGGRLGERRRVDFLHALQGSGADRSGNAFDNL